MQNSLATSLAFVWGALRDPRHVGALAPSSAVLAHRMVHTAARSHARSVIELGAGTGSITEALQANRGRFDDIYVLERDERYAYLLRERFAHVHVMNACASTTEQLASELAQPVAIISSLPFLSMPAQDASRCIEAIQRALLIDARSVMIHYTYAFSSKEPFSCAGLPLRWQRVARVWKNLPPATVWLLQQTAG
jgi:phosphatidylethanolamine/phosphatidyl-N-methylethanolamine N-methyltransferase